MRAILAMAAISLILLPLSPAALFPHSIRTSAASPGEFASARSSMQTAFNQTRAAESQGGDVSRLTVELNLGLALIQKAQSENSSDPSLASSDLSSAKQIAQLVSSQSPIAASEG